MAMAISTAQLAARLDHNEPIQVIDVRRKPVFDTATHLLADAVWRDPEEVQSWQLGLGRNQPVVVYCAHGHQVSQGCADVLATSGFDVRYLEGGIERWTTEGKSVKPISAANEK